MLAVVIIFTIMNFNDLLVDHDYYASDNNYYSKDASTEWNSFDEFYAEYINADVDMNLIYRWDIKTRDKEEIENGASKYYMELFIIKQRKGIYAPQFIHSISENDFDKIKKLLQLHLDKLANIWLPFSVSE